MELVEERYDAQMDGLYRPSFNIAPSQLSPIIKNDSVGTISLARWGFCPKWLYEKRPQGFINARSETIFENPMFQEAIEKKRCLVPADGFFEWKKEGHTKQPYYFYLSDYSIFSFAGIWDQWEQQDGTMHLSYSILTTNPNSVVEPVHNRMPVILGKDEEYAWLSESHVDRIAELLDPFPVFAMQMHAVSTQINFPRNNKKTLLEEVKI